MKLSYFISTAICRTYFFLTATLLGVIGAETWFHVGVMALAGLAIDVVRNFVVSDLRQPMSQVAAALSNASAGRMDPSTFRRPARLVYILSGSYAAYGFAIIIADWILGTDRTNEYFRLWSWLHKAVSPYMQMIGRHAGQIEALGFPHRIFIATHLYAVSAVAIVVTTVVVTSISMPLLITDAIKAVQKGGINPVSAPVPKRWLITIYTLVFGAYWLWVVIIPVEETGSRPWLIHLSNFPFVFLFLWSCFISMILGLLYGCLIRLRHQSWTGSSEHTTVVAQARHE